MTFQTDVNLVVETCGVCGVFFGMTQEQYHHVRNNKAQFFCTNGHQLTYRESEVQRLTRELAKKDQQLAQEKAAATTQRNRADQTERSLIAAKGHVTRLKNKAARGVCPCCDKHFPDLEHHMKAEHPEYEQTGVESTHNE